MKHTTNYLESFIEIAEDCKLVEAKVPVAKGKKESIAKIQYDLITKNPYKLTSDDIIFYTYAIRNEIPEKNYEKSRAVFFSKGQPCLRSSPLAKTYGYGIHFDKNRKVALYRVDEPEYQRLVNDTNIKKLKAMRSSKKKGDS